jgi:uncharacterized membrane protein (DUF2068 family)
MARRRALRAIALFEALKGGVALLAGLGLLSLLHHDLHHLATTLIGHVGLDPGGRYPALLLHYVDVLGDANRRTLVLTIAAYVAVRGAEAWGLWRERSWGEWLGALSGTLYVPFELRHLLHRPGIGGALVLVFNLAIVAFLGWQLWSERRSRAAAAA